MAGPDQGQSPEQEIAALFQNVGQGLVMINQYVAQAAPNVQPMVEELMNGYEQLVQAVGQARQGGAQRGPMPQETGAASARQAF